MNPHLKSLYSVSGILAYALNPHLNLGHGEETFQSKANKGQHSSLLHFIK